MSDQPPQPGAHAAEHAAKDPLQSQLRLCISPNRREMTEQERQDDPALFFILADEGTLGRVIGAPFSPVRVPAAAAGAALPNTAAMQAWLCGEVTRHSRSPLHELEPRVHANTPPPLPANVVIFHQLKQVEYMAMLSRMALEQSGWDAALRGQGLSAGHVFAVTNSALHQMGAPPFIGL